MRNYLQYYFYMNVPSRPERRRVQLPKTFLILNFVVDPLFVLFFLVAIIDPTLRQATLSQGGLTPEFYIILSICSFVFAIAIWKWKKWGVYGFIAIALAHLTVSITTGSQNILQNTLFGILSVLFLIFLFRPVWRYME